MTKENKERIDNSSYESLLSKWRYAPVGCELFQGDTGEYYSKVMEEKKNAIPHEDQVQASKNIGWE